MGDFLKAFSNRGVIIANTRLEVHAALKRLFLDDDFHHTQVLAAHSAAPQFSIHHSRRLPQEVFQRISPSTAASR
jgi:hypothetical protein